MLVAEWTGSLLAWERELAGLKTRLTGAFGRAELRRSAGAFIDGALSGVARKSCWQLAEQAGSIAPTGCSRCPGAAPGKRMACATWCALRC